MMLQLVPGCHPLLCLRSRLCTIRVYVVRLTPNALLRFVLHFCVVCCSCWLTALQHYPAGCGSMSDTPAWINPAAVSLLHAKAVTAGLRPDLVVSAFTRVGDRRGPKRRAIAAATFTILLAILIARLLSLRASGVDIANGATAGNLLLGVLAVFACAYFVRSYLHTHWDTKTLQRINLTYKQLVSLGLARSGIQGVDVAGEVASPGGRTRLASTGPSSRQTATPASSSLASSSVLPPMDKTIGGFLSPGRAPLCPSNVPTRRYNVDELAAADEHALQDALMKATLQRNVLDRGKQSVSGFSAYTSDNAAAEGLVRTLAQRTETKLEATRMAQGTQRQFIDTGVYDASARATIKIPADPLAEPQPEAQEFDAMSAPYFPAKKTGVDKVLPISTMLLKKRYKIDITDIERGAVSIAQTFRRHFALVFEPTLKRNTTEIVAQSKGHVPRDFLERTRRTARIPSIRSGDLLLDDVIAEKRQVADTRYSSTREWPPTGEQAKLQLGPFGRISRPANAVSNAVVSFGGRTVASSAPASLQKQEVVFLWQERAYLEAFLAVPGMLPADRRGTGIDPASYVLERLRQLTASGGDFSAAGGGDAWGVPESIALANDLPTDAQIIMHYLCTMLDAEVARWDPRGSFTVLDRPFSRHHVLRGKHVEENPVSLPPGLQTKEIAPLLGLENLTGALSRNTKLHVVQERPRFLLQIVHNDVRIDIASSEPSNSIARTMSAYTLLLLQEPLCGKIDGIDVRRSLIVFTQGQGTRMEANKHDPLRYALNPGLI
jgi:hypothetical protein